jgi:hypothetical protein
MGKKVVCEGEWVRMIGKVSSIDWFEDEIFILDDSVEDQQVALSIIQNTKIADRLRRSDKYEGFKRVRTCSIAKFVTVAEESEEAEEEKLLVEAINLDCVPETLGNYTGKIRQRKIKESIDGRKKAIAKNRSEVGVGKFVDIDGQRVFMPINPGEIQNQP